MRWTPHASITPVGDGSFSTRVDEQWIALQGVHGGLVAALVVEAAATALADHGVGPDTVLRAGTFGYLATNEIGESAIDIDVVRQGRSMVTCHGRVTQNGHPTTVARLHFSAPRSGLSFSDGGDPIARPADAVRLERPPPSHFHNVETWLHPSTTMFGGADRAEWLAWSRPLDQPGVNPGSFDAAWLTMYGDYFPPPVFARLDGPTPAVTIEYSIQIHDHARQWTLDPDTYLAARMHTFHSHDGFAVEDGTIHLPDGSLLATVRQTRLSG